ncbi:TolC family protein [uncultured Shewanella sp.]|uniref:TolC family protein n=1 Tax=uncultured Shewanella sp. TaxID=173975 RepID=UPI00263565C3|nr:TolC family protein [uncultured Shewanella sp.]
MLVNHKRYSGYCLYRALLFNIVLFGSLSACVVGPDYVRPELNPAQHYLDVDSVLPSNHFHNTYSTHLYTEAKLQMNSLPPYLANFRWEDFYLDPYLRSLIQHAIDKNLTVKNMQSQLLEARATFIATDAERYPTFDLEGSVEPERLSGETNSPPLNKTIIDLSGVLAWELDLWGGFERGSESAFATMLSTRELLHYSYVSLIGDLATNYYEWLDSHQRHLISENTVKLRKKAYDLAQLRHKNGVISGLEVQQSEVEYQTALATLPDLILEKKLAESQLRILLGEFDFPLEPPLEMDSIVDTIVTDVFNNSMHVQKEANKTSTHFSSQNKQLSKKDRKDSAQNAVTLANAQVLMNTQQFPNWFALGVPSQLLKFRPDVRAAEQALIAANADIGLAESALFPSFTITGTYGLEALSLADLFTQKGIFWSLLSDIVAPIYNAGSLSADVEIARQVAIQAQLTYRNTLLTAYFEVNDAIQSYKRAEASILMQTTLVDAAAKYTHLARLRYINGVASSLDFMDAQRNLFSAQLSLSQIQRDKLLAMVELYRSVGGGARPTFETPAVLESTF